MNTYLFLFAFLTYILTMLGNLNESRENAQKLLAFARRLPLPPVPPPNWVTDPVLLFEGRGHAARGCLDVAEIAWFQTEARELVREAKAEEAERPPWKKLLRPQTAFLKRDRIRIPVQLISIDEVILAARYGIWKLYWEQNLPREAALVVPDANGARGLALRNNIKAYLQKQQTEPIFDYGRKVLRKQFMSLAAENQYLRLFPLQRGVYTEWDLLNMDLEPHEKEMLNEELMCDPRTSWAEFKVPAVSEQVWLLVTFAYALNDVLDPSIRFDRDYILWWNEWGLPAAHEKLMRRKFIYRKALPLIVHMGANCWCVMDRGTHQRTPYFTDVGDALAFWIWMVQTQFANTLENGQTLPPLFQ